VFTLKDAPAPLTCKRTLAAPLSVFPMLTLPLTVRLWPLPRVTVLADV
jgi:hypothetical protein